MKAGDIHTIHLPLEIQLGLKALLISTLSASVPEFLVNVSQSGMIYHGSDLCLTMRTQNKLAPHSHIPKTHNSLMEHTCIEYSLAN